VFTVDIDVDIRAYFTSANIIANILLFQQKLKYLDELQHYTEQRLIIFLFFYDQGFIFLFTIGALTGIILSNSSIDIILHDTYYVIM